MRLTKDILLESGWQEYGSLMVLRAVPRFGWYAGSGKLIVGFTEVPFAVWTVEELQAFLDVFKTGRKISCRYSG